MIFNPDLQRSLTGSLDTIVALGTPSGRGALAVIRLTGDRAIEIAERHISPWPINAREARLCAVHDGNRMLDQAVVTVYIAPQSFTGEDIVEISTHGGHVVPASVMTALISSGAREALPGEFTRRAVLNGKLDIMQAEAIKDLIDAQSSAMQQAALNQLEGGLSSRIASLRESVLSLESLIAYDVDFPEEDDGPISQERIIQSTDDLLGRLDLLLSTIPVGQIVRDGAIVVIAGEPNVGKSSLFNALLGENRAIVTETSGTTRDAIEGLINAGRWPMRLIDTAGLRESGDIVERLGIETSERYIAHAHLLLACGENEASLERTMSAVSTMSSAPIIAVLTKCDLSPDTRSGCSESKPSGLRVSATTGDGLGLLQCEMESRINQMHGELAAEVPVLMRARHVQAIEYARTEIWKFRTAWVSEMLPAPVAAVHLRTTAVTLEGLIGAVSTDDVLERLFSSFCVGK
jgi:tRNA modification GTPase